jgi:hypothetical protein
LKTDQYRCGLWLKDDENRPRYDACGLWPSIGAGARVEDWRGCRSLRPDGGFLMGQMLSGAFRIA